MAVSAGSDPGMYAGMGEAWAEDVALVYGPLAVHLVARAPDPVRGALALDAGAGSGLAGAALRARGARVVAVDQELDMARRAATAGAAVVGDVTALPFGARVFDLVVAAFVVNHLSDPVSGLAQLRQVTRADGAVLASMFSADRAEAKAVVDAVAQRHGYVPPPRYVEMQRHAAAVSDPASVERVLDAAGFASWTVTEEAVDVGLTDPADVVRYRLAMPQLRWFLSGLGTDDRRAVRDEAVTAVRRSGAAFAPVVIEVVARP